ncbi:MULTISPECIES: AAA family ATPase [unclassified Bacillus (in: firmicutes)]|uniref:ATP-binding protein n=1 Tax=unclassified Bacillus (in: firmicutes) TaxID=185979 RepID=UPI0008ECD011|nr:MULTISPECIES: AAA family ATPase [unclassified Bacillus (in: firmicutes)]SFA80048.1 Uncharacterized protein YhaN [Bacillus sp. UNCCL13]SFQ70114.1 Uncharacterized protein YhaN [Bacillus sp. cl95]
MRITELYIYGFGQLNDLDIRDLSDFQVFFGENEAGKSTLSAFIHAILFGFPTKQQSDLRYEPKHQTKYGGKLKAHFPDRGYAVIERVKGKAVGDVTVVLEDGTRGNELLLKELLSNVDRSLYQAIFSFNIHGLQNIHQIKNEDIGKFLFSAGTLGTDSLSIAENELQKELDLRFKPSGKKPIINEKLQELHELNADLKKAAAKNHAYEQLIVRKTELENDLNGLRNAIEDLRLNENKLKEWIRVRPNFLEEKSIIRDLEKIGEFNFPIHGIQRIEKLLLLLNPLDAQLSTAKENAEQISRELESLKPNQEILAHESAILSLLEKLPLLEQMKLEEAKLKNQKEETNEKLNVLKEKLHLSIPYKEIFEINTNIFVKQEVEEAYIKSQKLSEKMKDLDDSFNEEKKELENLEEEMKRCREQLLSEEERSKYSRSFKSETGIQKAETEMGYLQEKILFYNNADQQEKKRMKEQQKKKQFQLMVFAVIITLLLVYFIMTKQWNLAAIGFFVNILLILLGIKNKDSKPTSTKNEVLEELIEQEASLRENLRVMKSGTDFHAIKMIEKDDQLLNQLKSLELKWEQKNIQYEKVLAKFEAWEEEVRQNEQQVRDLCASLKLPYNIGVARLIEGYQMIEQLKANWREIIRIDQRLQDINDSVSKIEVRLKFYSDKFFDGQDYDIHHFSFTFKRILKEETEKQIQCEAIGKKYKETVDHLQELLRQQRHMKGEVSKLLEEADAEDEQQFMLIGRKAEDRIKLNKRLQELERQKSYSFLTQQDLGELEAILDVEASIMEFDTKVKFSESRYAEMQDQLAKVKYELQVIEDGGLYSELMHTFKEKKYELEEAAREWASYSLAQNILYRTVEKYKNQRLPQMLEKAEEFFVFLTEGKYRRIHLKDSGTGFIIENKDHTLFEANELSQATMEQVYVALRLSLAVTLYEKYSLPIMIDDSFVNFDEKRTSKIMQLLKKLNNNQILFYTCHKHMLKYFNESDILWLDKGKVRIHS